MEINEILAILMFVTFIGTLFLGFPVAWTLGGIAIVFAAISMLSDAYLDTWIGVDWPYVSLVIDDLWNTMQNWVLVALPMFIFMGLMLDRSGIAEQMMESFSQLFGRMRGGLAITVTVIGIMLAASTGIIGASVVLLTLLSLPIMLKNGYNKGLAVGTICASGTLGILIPPSIMLVIMADRLAMSVGDLFLGAVFPGLLLGGLYMIYIVTVAALYPSQAPAPPHVAKMSLTVLWGVLRAALPPAFLILAVLGTIFFGVATPTEASGVGAFGAILLAWWNKRLNLTVWREVVRQTTTTTAFIFGILVGASAFAIVLRGLGGDDLIADALLGLDLGRHGTIIVIMLMVFLLGFVLDWIQIVLILLILVAPVVKALGFDIVWFTILFAVCLQTSFLTPPVGLALFYLKGVAPPEVTVRDIYRGIVPFVLIQLIGLTVVYLWPELVTWLPQQAYGR
ncbi:MAG: TRAP transporter large permease subunit [Rhodospirillales bacterium]|nr:MAG: TRAP transporter large permease subunit [Rhodospirillales bacterium]